MEENTKNMFRKNSPKSTLILLVSIIAILQLGCKSQEPDEISNLIQSQTFGDGYRSSDGYISQSLSIASDRTRYLYVADQGRSRVLQYTLDGEFIQMIGSPGKGPGEFSYVLQVEASEDVVCVADYRNLRVSFFNPQGGLMDMFEIDHIYMGEFALSKNRIVMGGRVGSFQTAGLEEEKRFNLFDWEGNKLSAFGTFLPFDEEGIPARMNLASIRIYKGLLHVAYGYFPVYQIYDLDTGTLLVEHNLEELTAIEGVDKNSRGSTFQDLQAVDVEGIVRGLDVVDGSVFLMHYDEELLFFEEFKLSGTHINHQKSHVFVKKRGGIRTISDSFLFVPSRQSFYTLETSMEGGFRISEYKIMKHHKSENPPVTNRQQ